MNIGVSVGFPTGILNTSLLKTFFSFFFQFCNFVCSVQYAIFIRLIHLFLYALAQHHSVT